MESFGFEVAHSSNSFLEADVIIKKNKPDVLILFIDSNAPQAVNLALQARKINPKVGLVFMTSVPDIRLLGIDEKDLPRGVQIILKSSVIHLDALTQGIKQSIQNLEEETSATKVNSTSFTHKSESTSNLQSLTQVQFETLRLVALGNSNAEIARIRLVTEKAVEHTITRMLQALKIVTNPHHNARVLISREYYRWNEVDNQSPKLVS